MNRVSDWGRWIARHRVRVTLFAAGAAVLLILSLHSLPRSDAADRKKQGAGDTVAIEAAAVTRANVPVNVEGLGTVQAFNTVTVTSRVDGALQKLGFIEGQMVHKGDLLAQIDPRPFQAALGLAEAAQAKDEAQLASARQDLQRYTILAPQNLASQQVLDAQRATVAALVAQVKGDQANIDNAHTQLEYSTITSPIDGRTGIRKVDVGNNVHATDTSGIVVVTQLQPINVIFTLPEEDLPEINQALSAGELQVAAYARDESTKFDSGTVQLVDNQIDQATGTIRIKAVFPNKGSALWPGQYVNARVLVRTQENVLTIPDSAVQRGPDGLFAYVIKPDSTVEVRALQIGQESNGIAVVKSGLRAGERVATSNQYRLEPGVHVRILQPATSSTEVAKRGDGPVL